MRDFSRRDRLSAQIGRELSEIISINTDLPDGMMISITEVELSRDLRVGKVFYSVIGGDNPRENAEKFLADQYKHIRMELARRLRVKFTPELQFKYDTSMERGQRISELLDRIKKDEEQ